MPKKRICSVEDCSKPYKSRGLCNTHYEQWRRNSPGHPQIGDRIQTESGTLLRWINEVAVSYKGDDCLIWPFNKSSNGYGLVRVNGRPNAVHRLVCKLVHGEPPTADHESAHSCGNGHLGCVNPAHLRWATTLENQRDRFIHGTHCMGMRNGSAKLTAIDVLAIRDLKGKLGQRKIAARFGVTKSTIARIHNGSNWRSL